MRQNMYRFTMLCVLVYKRVETGAYAYNAKEVINHSAPKNVSNILYAYRLMFTKFGKLTERSMSKGIQFIHIYI